jgi:hypothetical protein
MSDAKDMEDKHKIIVEKYVDNINQLQTERNEIKDA